MEHHESELPEPTRPSIAWRTHLIELLTVFVGVTLAFLADQWRDQLRAREQERTLLQGLAADVAYDTTMIETLLNLHRESLEELDAYIDNHQQRTNTESHQLPPALLKLGRVRARSASYESAKSSGGFANVENQVLKKEIISYYQDLEEIQAVDDVNQRFLNVFILPFLMKHFNLGSGQPIDPETLRSTEYLNLVYGARVTISQVVTYYEALLERNRKLAAALAKPGKS